MRDGFVARYDTGATQDGLPPGEGAFLACTFWLADNYALLGRHGRGARRSSSGCSRCATTWACSPRSTTRTAKRLVGNFPQAFSHVGLVNAALHLHRKHEGPIHHRKET